MTGFMNGVPHLVMSLATYAIGVYLIYRGNYGLGCSMLGLVSAAWFVPAAATHMGKELTSQVSGALPILPMLNHLPPEPGPQAPQPPAQGGV